MKINKSLIIAVAAVSAVSATSAYSQTRPNVKSANLKLTEIKGESNSSVSGEIDFKDLKYTKKVEQAALARDLAPKIQRATEKQGIKANRAQITEASNKLAALLIHSDITQLEEAVPGISIKIKITFSKPLQVSIEVKF